MSTKFWLAALIAVPLLVAALVYGRNLTRCHQTESASATAADSDAADSKKSECYSSDKSQSCPPEGRAGAPEQTLLQGSDPDRQMVFQVEGLRCPAVKGIGCGHMLHPVLASLDKLEGVEASSTNYTGTMIRVAVTTATDRAKVAEQSARLWLSTSRSPLLATNCVVLWKRSTGAGRRESASYLPSSSALWRSIGSRHLREQKSSTRRPRIS